MHSLSQSLVKVSNPELLASIKNLKSSESQTIAEIVLRIFEINSRGIYRDAGYSNLFNYCTRCLGYSEGAAWRRIQASRTLKGNPEFYGLLKSGELSLCTLAEIAKVLKPENKEEILEASIGKSKSEVLKLTARYQAPSSALKKERVRVQNVVSAKQDTLPLFAQALGAPEEIVYSLTMQAPQKVMTLIEKTKDYMGQMPLVDLLEKLMTKYIAEQEKNPRVVQRSKMETPAKQPSLQENTPYVAATRSRYLSKSTRYQVKQRDGHQCTFTSSDGHRCTETRSLQFDHVYPYALGGSNNQGNLRLLCPAHNRLCAEQVFGRAKIEFLRHGGGKHRNQSSTN